MNGRGRWPSQSCANGGSFLRPAAAGLLSTAVLVAAPLAEAQELAYPVMAVPEVVCRAAPSHTSGVVEVLEVTGEIGTVGWARTRADERGETWVHVFPHVIGRPWLSEGCWVLESKLASGWESGHLRTLADPLVSADELPPFEHLLAVHTLFGHPVYRERVAKSTALARLRTALAAKAVEAAQWGWLGHRPVDRDLRIITWIESFGDRVRYSEDASGWGEWHVEMSAAETEAGRGDGERTEPAAPGRELAVVAPDAACRVRPSRTAPASRVLRLDLHFRTHRADTAVGGEAWVFHPPGSCWVAAAHTAPGDSPDHVTLMADRFLTSGEGWSTDNHLALLAVLSSRHWGHRDVVEASPVLGLRRLAVLRGVLRTGEFISIHPRYADAVTLAWIAALGPDIALTAEGHAWTVSDEAYLTLYGRHRSDPFAEEILWTYASESDAYSCEGDYLCDVEQAVNRRLARYWTEFPDGRHIAGAVESARTALGRVLDECVAAHAATAESLEARRWRWYGGDERGPEIALELAASLERVDEGAKAPLLATLRELENCADK